jgi:hypothetical protein
MRGIAGLPPVYWWLWLGYLLSSLGTRRRRSALAA